MRSRVLSCEAVESFGYVEGFSVRVDEVVVRQYAWVRLVRVHVIRI
jgi:hypothetical protein